MKNPFERPTAYLKDVWREPPNLGLGAFYGVCVGISVFGNTQAAAGETGWLGWSTALSLVAIGAFEFAGVILAHEADKRRELGEKAVVTRVLSAVIAAAAVFGATAGHINRPGQAAFFGVMSALGYAVYLIRSNTKRRDAMRARNELPPPPPAFGTWQWLRHPLRTRRALALDRGVEDRVASALHQEEVQRRDARTVKVAKKLAYEAMVKEFGKDRADLMIGLVHFPGAVDGARVQAEERRHEIETWLAEKATMPGTAPSVALDSAPHRTAPSAPLSAPHREVQEVQCDEESSAPPDGAPRLALVRRPVIEGEVVHSATAIADAEILAARYPDGVPSDRKVMADLKWTSASKVTKAKRALADRKAA